MSNSNTKTHIQKTLFPSKLRSVQLTPLYFDHNTRIKYE